MKNLIVKQLKESLAKGRTASVTFLKADGSVRYANIRQFKEAAFASGDKNNVQPSTVRHIPSMNTVFDIGNDKFINFRTERLLSAKFEKTEITFKE